MALTRPAYRATITSYARGWVVQATAGDPADPDPDTPVVLDRLVLRWGWDAAAYPGQLVPATVTWAIRAGSTSQLPTAATGDHVNITLDRPGPDGPIEYVSLDAILGDPSVSLVHGGAVMALTAVDLVADLAERPIGGPPWPDVDIVFNTNPVAVPDLDDGRLPRLMRLAGANLIVSSADFDQSPALGPLDVDNRSAFDLVTEILAAPYRWRDQWVIRAIRRPPTDPVFDTAFTKIISDPTWPITYFLQATTNYAGYALPLRLVVDGDLATVLPPDPAGIAGTPGLTVIPAAACPIDSAEWVNSRANATNQVVLEGLNAAGEPVTVTASHPDLVRTYGANVRTVRSQISNPDYRSVTPLLPDWASALPKWTLPTVTIDTSLTTDELLDDLAGQVYPHAQPDRAAADWWMHRPVLLAGLDPARNMRPNPANVLSGALTGATFTITGGRLEITAEIKPYVFDTYSGTTGTSPNRLTYAAMRADPQLAAITYRGPAPHWDPALTYDVLRLIGV